MLNVLGSIKLPVISVVKVVGGTQFRVLATWGDSASLCKVNVGVT